MWAEEEFHCTWSRGSQGRRGGRSRSVTQLDTPADGKCALRVILDGYSNGMKDDANLLHNRAIGDRLNCLVLFTMKIKKTKE